MPEFHVYFNTANATFAPLVDDGTLWRTNVGGGVSAGTLQGFCKQAIILANNPEIPMAELPVGFVVNTNADIPQIHSVGFSGANVNGNVRVFVNNVFIVEEGNPLPFGANFTITRDCPAVTRVQDVINWSFRADIFTDGGNVGIYKGNASEPYDANNTVLLGQYAIWSAQFTISVNDEATEITITYGGVDDKLDELDGIEGAYFDEDDVLQSIPLNTISRNQTQIVVSTTGLPAGDTEFFFFGNFLAGQQFSGSVMLGIHQVLVADGSGIYQLVVGKRNDTIYDRDTPGATIDVKIPNPFIKSGFVP